MTFEMLCQRSEIQNMILFRIKGQSSVYILEIMKAVLSLLTLSVPALFGFWFKELIHGETLPFQKGICCCLVYGNPLQYSS